MLFIIIKKPPLNTYLLNILYRLTEGFAKFLITFTVTQPPVRNLDTYLPFTYINLKEVFM